MTTDDHTRYGNRSNEEMDQYTEEARTRWGNTDAFETSQQRVKKMGKEGLGRVLKESGALTAALALCMKEGNAATSDQAQQLITSHYEGLRVFYEPNPEIYAGLADMYVTDPRFKEHYERVAEGLAQFMHDAMCYFLEPDVDSASVR